MESKNNSYNNILLSKHNIFNKINSNYFNIAVIELNVKLFVNTKYIFDHFLNKTIILKKILKECFEYFSNLSKCDHILTKLCECNKNVINNNLKYKLIIDSCLKLIHNFEYNHIKKINNDINNIVNSGSIIYFNQPDYKLYVEYFILLNNVLKKKYNIDDEDLEKIKIIINKLENFNNFNVCNCDEFKNLIKPIFNQINEENEIFDYDNLLKLHNEECKLANHEKKLLFIYLLYNGLISDYEILMDCKNKLSSFSINSEYDKLKQLYDNCGNINDMQLIIKEKLFSNNIIIYNTINSVCNYNSYFLNELAILMKQYSSIDTNNEDNYAMCDYYYIKLNVLLKYFSKYNFYPFINYNTKIELALIIIKMSINKINMLSKIS